MFKNIGTNKCFLSCVLVGLLLNKLSEITHEVYGKFNIIGTVQWFYLFLRYCKEVAVFCPNQKLPPQVFEQSLFLFWASHVHGAGAPDPWQLHPLRRRGLLRQAVTRPPPPADRDAVLLAAGLRRPPCLRALQEAARGILPAGLLPQGLQGRESGGENLLLTIIVEDI